MTKVTSQVRWYYESGIYAHTTTVDHHPEVKADISGLFGYKAPGMLPVNPCNLMLRVNGKLVSYKDFQ